MERISTSEVQSYEKEHAAALRQAAPACMLFLKRNGDFPLEEPGKIALYGSGARNTLQGGTGSGEVNVRHVVSIEEGLEKAGFEITTKSWLFQYDLLRRQAKKPWVERMKAEARSQGENPATYAMGAVMPEPEYELPLTGAGDTAVYVLARISGEGSDRNNQEGDFLLSATEKRDILALVHQYRKFLLVLNVGGPMDLSGVEEVENILLLSQTGMVIGDAFADVLLGKAYPSGKLTTTWAPAAEYQRIGTFDEEDDTRYQEGIYVGYRFFQAAGRKAAWPFGFGLGYTSFAIETDDRAGFEVKDDEVRVRASVKNTGRFPGKEVVQLYYSLPEGRLDQPFQQLGAWAKTKELAPGESAEVLLTVPMENMSSYDEDSEAWILEKGTIVFRIGNSSESTKAVGAVRLDEDVIVEKAVHVCGRPDFEDWKPERKPGENVRNKDRSETSETEAGAAPAGIPVIPVHSETLSGKGHFEKNRRPAEDHTAEMRAYDLGIFSEEDLVRICIGKFREGKGPAGLSMIGDQGASVAGTAGESADVLQSNRYGKLILSDGPAGLRIAKDYILTEKGAKDISLGSLSFVMDFIPKHSQKLLEQKQKLDRKALEGKTIYHQYASSIPIGTALAQSWDPDLVQGIGEIVGEEMRLFGINVWLAPALNIHRSVLCGRNFEYYSEDPLLAGKMAAAMTKGVQKDPGCAVTIKHFVCNNQEFNRTHSNSIVSERALREIYLKGFEICVKEAQPHFLMSSYNLLNGRHTANSKDLLTEVLRKEWGFEGVVMTDWYTTTDLAPVKKKRKYGNSVPSECIAAGNDMIEPGNVRDKEQILAALHGKDPVHPLDRKELEACVRRILYWTQRLSVSE